MNFELILGGETKKMILGHSVTILLIEDNIAEARLLQEYLQQAESKQFSLVHVKRLGDALNALRHKNYDVILLDLTLPDSQGLSSLSLLIEQSPSIPIVVLTNTNDEDLAIEAVRQGAQDYLVKRQVNVHVLVRALCYAIERKQTLESLRILNKSLENRVEESTAELVKAQEINQFKSEFVSMFSHDIRNPLNTILLAAGLLQDNEEKLSQEKKHSHFQMIRSAIKNMAQLLDEVSFIGKADAGKLRCDLIAVDLEAFCRQLVEEFQLAIKDKQIKVIFNCPQPLEPILLDESLFRHILGNLLGNAIKYSNPEGQVKLELLNQEKTITLRIQDSGIGISIEDQKQLFQPFHRGDNVGGISGTGLGLAIVKKCVDAHEGEIFVDSEVGVGTTVTVIFPKT